MGDIEGRCSQLPVTCGLSAPSTPGLHSTGVLVLHSALSDPRAGTHAGPPSRTQSILPIFPIPLEVSPSLLYQTFSGPLPRDPFPSSALLTYHLRLRAESLVRSYSSRLPQLNPSYRSERSAPRGTAGQCNVHPQKPRSPNPSPSYHVASRGPALATKHLVDCVFTEFVSFSLGKIIISIYIWKLFTLDKTAFLGGFLE